MKNTLILFTLLLFSSTIFGQEEHSKYLLKTDTTWQKEIFPLPTGFAQEMTLKGFEDASFPPGWGKVESENLWSYVFVWSVDAKELVTVENLESELQIYFDGLMGIPKDTIIAPKKPSTAVLVKTAKTDIESNYTGKVRTFDNFRKQQMMTLNVRVEQQLCEAQEKAIIVFKFSPQAFEHEVWRVLDEAILRQDACIAE